MDWPGAEFGTAPAPRPQLSTLLDRSLGSSDFAFASLPAPRPLPPERFAWAVHPARPWAGGCRPMLLPTPIIHSWCLRSAMVFQRAARRPMCPKQAEGDDCDMVPGRVGPGYS